MTAVQGRTVLTTGANSGVGLATVVHLARMGFHSVGSVRSRAKAACVAEAAAAASVTVETVVLDVTDAERCRAVVDRLRPWGLVNNAGYSGVGAIEDVSDDEARRQLETMVVAPMRLARLALPHMTAVGEGRIVNISSIYGRTTTPFSGWYQASKHALEAASDALRIEVAHRGVTVVLIEPGAVKTHIWEEMEADLARRAGSRYDVQYRRVRTLVAPYRFFMSRPELVAKAIGRALSVGTPRARYVVGRDAQGIVAAQPFVPTAVRDRVTRLLTGL
ncbi:MAG TPA: SDR family NAD(P)-dependent oxidoreductase [Acidimicrobiales bacterium]|nr:SDR family NAD(P)-dependent oxidoreductase [Acidimicrobiales bacterium]